MALDVGTFKGEAPRIAPRLLPNDMGQLSTNARLLSGNLEAWKDFNSATSQAIVSSPATIYYLDDQLWLSWSSVSFVPGGSVNKLWDVALSTPFWDAQLGVAWNGNGGNNLYGVIIGNDGTTVRLADYKAAATWTTASASPGTPPVGDGTIYQVSSVNGSYLGSRAANSAEQLIWPSLYGGAGGSSPGPGGYPGPGGTPTYLIGSDNSSIALPLANGNIVFGIGLAQVWTWGSTSPSSYIPSVVQCYVANPYTNEAIYDVVPAMTDTVAHPYSAAHAPCADGKHVFFINWSQNTTSGGTTTASWHVLLIGPTSASEIATGPWTIGPEVLNSTGGGVYGNSQISSQFTIPARGAGDFAMLESDLQHLWFVTVDGKLVCVQLTNGSDYTTVYSNLTPYVVNNYAGYPTWYASDVASSIWADNGILTVLIGNQLSSWGRGSFQPAIVPPAIEVDIAKMAIGGDTSYRTIFCGTDVPRFTDLGLASGLVDGSSHPITGSSTLGSSTGPYPAYSRKLGVPNPTVAISNPQPSTAAASTVAVTITETFDGATKWNLNSVPGIASAAIVVSGGNPGACLTTRGINYAEAFGWKTQPILNSVPVTMSVQFAYQRLANDYLLYTYLDFFFSLDSGTSGSVVRLHTTAAGIDVIWAPVNSGVIGTTIASVSIPSGSIPGWTVDGDPNWTGAFVAGTWFTATLAITPAANPATASVVLTIKHGATTVLTQTQANLPNAGPGYGMGCTQVSGQPMPDWAEVWWDNLILTGQGPATTPASLTATTYLYTLVNDLGEESGPSPAMITTDGSGVIQRLDGQSISVPLPGTLTATGVDTSYFQGGSSFIPTTQIAPNTSIPSPSMNLYRAVTGSSGTSFLLVEANIPFSGGSSTVYVDSVADAALSEEIASLLWNPPDTSMVGILALPNGIYAGFHGNELDLSVQAIPHAWPIEYRLNFDWDIVGIEAIDSTIVVCTKKFPYLCSGNTPDAYSSTKASYPYACASKRSIQYLKNVGVVFATFEGLVAIAGPGIEKLITESLFSKDEWLALNPTSMVAAINDNRYFCWYTTVGGTKGGFYIDVNDGAAGKVSMGQHAIARYNDPLTDTLYEVLDYSSTGTTTGIIVGFNTAASTLMPYTWKSKQFFLPWPTAYQFCRVSADSYASLTLNLFADGTQYGGNITITSQTEFSLPLPPNGVCFKYFEFELIGTDKVNRVQFVEDIEEFQ